MPSANDLPGLPEQELDPRCLLEGLLPERSKRGRTEAVIRRVATHRFATMLGEGAWEPWRLLPYLRRKRIAENLAGVQMILDLLVDQPLPCYRHVHTLTLSTYHVPDVGKNGAEVQIYAIRTEPNA